MRLLDERPFEIILAEEIQESLRVGINRASDCLARAEVFDEEKSLDRKYDWGAVSLRSDAGTDLLNRFYLDDSKRDVDELALMAIRGCSIEVEAAKRLSNDLSQVLARLQGREGYSIAMVDGFRNALGCVARLNIWLGRVDFTARAREIGLHEKRINKINSEKGFKRNSGLAEYRDAIFNLMFRCLENGLGYDDWGDVINFNEPLFVELNISFSNRNSKVQVVKPSNLPEKIKLWARGNDEVRKQLDRLKSELERRNKKKRSTGMV